MEGSSRPVIASGLRFHLAEGRIREFLIGESLYGDPALAVREAYQNALDAWRLLIARQKLLGVPPDIGSAQDPVIEFHQGTSDDGRAYIDCVDRGAGMGLVELAGSFCHAGVRASDLDERAREIEMFAAADPPVEFWQNSLFGIGVLSYFMVASEISVRTARLNSDGTIGNLLAMHIPGPAEEFDIVDLGPSTSCGTHVRLWLKPSAEVSAVSTLRKLVVVCPVTLSAIDDRGPQHLWLPDELNRASTPTPPPPPYAQVAIPGELWWIAPGFPGAVVVDGIWVGQWFKGVIVNLRGPLAPRLTADRRSIIDLRTSVVSTLAERSAAEAVEHCWSVVGDTAWLSSMSELMPRVADAVVEAASSRADRTLSIHGTAVDIRISGFMSGDEGVATSGAPGEVIDWRFARLQLAGQFPKLRTRLPTRRVVPARPSDAVLLGSSHHQLSPKLNPKESLRWSSSTSLLYEAERHLAYPLADIVERAKQLCLPTRDDAHLLPPSTELVRTALSFSDRWRPDGSFKPLAVFDVIRTSWELDVPIARITEELGERFIETQSFDRETAMLTSAELVCASAGTNGIAPWSATSEELGLDHIVRAARAAGITCAQAIEILNALGFDATPDLTFPDHLPSDDDIVMLSRDLDGQPPFLSAAVAYRTAHVRRAARELGYSESEARERFKTYGVTFSPTGVEPPLDSVSEKAALRRLPVPVHEFSRVRPRHLRMISRDADGQQPWLDPTLPVPAWMVAVHARGKRSIDEVISDYRWLGFTVDDPRITSIRPTPGPPDV
ncbi:hypothetical protein N1031_08720 [Herbiconiux moechotypicola]|uniref:wHTH-Hsp90 Na associated domain-containing protein n=2 Tax=Herbiconiux moechotypicola TaxID=637393 RepID=A0ABP5QG91_9MICO|nr:hypothetical protein [Herbiconiux moechotypicola]MCS5729840.1 hypothetical protein [Herbiconiux moechotypicola]